jgi:serine/threonine-protein kinase
MTDSDNDPTIVRTIYEKQESGSLLESHRTSFITRSLDRLAVLALVFGMAAIVLLIVNKLIVGVFPGGVDTTTPVKSTLLLLLPTTSMLMWWVISRRKFADALLTNLGIAYVLLIGLCISLFHAQSFWWLEQTRLVGVTWLSVWIVLFPLIIPTTFRNSIIITGLLVISAPLGIWLSVITSDVPGASFINYFDITLPTLITAGIAVFIARLIFQLNKEVREAQQLGSYRLQHKLGAGGMGEVWQAAHVMLSRPAAIKLIQPEILELGEERLSDTKERFFREAKATSGLTSPHTIQVFDFGISGESTFYLVMELLEGDDLNWLIKRYGYMPPNRVVYLLLQVCESLIEAHERGLIHRDIKPANIFVCQLGLQYDFIKVLDFGIAESVANLKKESMNNAVEGTPAFMAPECFTREGGIGIAADIYAFGCLAYWMLSARYVFEENAERSIAQAHEKENPLPPSARVEQSIPDFLDNLILACLEKKPVNRPSTFMEIKTVLNNCELDEPWTQEVANVWWKEHE